MPIPIQQPGQSRQDWRTPPELLRAIQRRLGIREGFIRDVAASQANTICDSFYDGDLNGDGLQDAWSYREEEGGWVWCNPPYGDIEPWVAKATREADGGTNACLLVPAAVGANWWKRWVEPNAYVLHLNGRITFMGATQPYPKDCSLLLYTPWKAKGSEVWTWKNQ